MFVTSISELELRLGDDSSTCTCEVLWSHGPFALESNRNTIDHNGSQIKQLIMLLEPLNKFTSYHNCWMGATVKLWSWCHFGRHKIAILAMAWIWSTNQKSKLFSCHHLPATHADTCEVPMWNSGLPCRDAEVLHSNCTHAENETASLLKACSQYLSVLTIEKLLRRVSSMALETRASFIRTTVRKTEFEAPPSRSAAASSKASSRSGWSSKDLGKTMKAACQIFLNAATSSDDCACLSETGNMGSPWLGRTWWTKSMCSAKPASWLKKWTDLPQLSAKTKDSRDFSEKYGEVCCENMVCKEPNPDMPRFPSIHLVKKLLGCQVQSDKSVGNQSDHGSLQSYPAAKEPRLVNSAPHVNQRDMFTCWRAEDKNMKRKKGGLTQAWEHLSWMQWANIILTDLKTLRWSQETKMVTGDNQSRIGLFLQDHLIETYVFVGVWLHALCHEHYKITIKVYESHIGPQWKQQITRDACRRRGHVSGQECNALQSFPPVRLSKDEIVHCECFMCL